VRLESFSDALIPLAAGYGLSISPGQCALLHHHMRLMLEWNRRMNLTRITNPGEIIVRHILDSLIPGQWLPSSGSAVDVGTGAGFPGIPLKILHPNLRMVLVEAQRKKVSFLRVALAGLRMEGTWTVQKRWEDLPGEKHAGFEHGCTLITMRAVKLQAEHITQLAPKILRPGGVFAWWTSAGEEACIELSGDALAGAGMRFSSRFAYRLPSIEAERVLLVWERF
jgi:16S rRNA (guanine527-N7)-methyltransferase